MVYYWKILDTLNEIKTASSLNLLEFISWKEEYKEEAEEAFREFGYRFQEFILKTSEITCAKWNKNEVVALDIAMCTLERVWKYPTYNHEKSNATNIDKGIKLWLTKIIYTQLANHHNKGTCYEPKKETDLTLIHTIDELVDKKIESEETKKSLKLKLQIVDEALSSLTYKHKIIYLTYKLYVPNGEYIPRDVSKKLQEELSLTSASIRKYKEQAIKQVATCLDKING